MIYLKKESTGKWKVISGYMRLEALIKIGCKTVDAIDVDSGSIVTIQVTDVNKGKDNESPD